MPRQKDDRVGLGAALVLAAVIVLSVVAAASYISMNRWVDHTLQVRQDVDEWTIDLMDAWSNGRGSVVTGQGSLVSNSDAAVALERATAARVKALVADSPSEIENVETANRDAEAAIASMRSLVALAQSGHRDEALAHIFAGDGRNLMATFRAETRRIRVEEDRLLVERRADAGRTALLMLGGGFLLMLSSIVSLVVAWRAQQRRAELLERLGTVVRRRIEALSDLATDLAKVRTRAEVAGVVLERGVEAAGADTCTLYLLDEAGTALELIGDRGVAPEVLERVRRITETSGASATFATLRTGAALWGENEGDYARLFPRLVETKTTERRAKAFWSLPLVVEGRPVGLLGMGFYEPRTFSPDERVFIETFTKQCAQALLRATHLEREDEANRLIAREQARREFLARAGEALVSSLDYRTTLGTLTRLAVPELADWCAVSIVEPGAKSSHQVAVAHMDPGKVQFAKELGERYPPDPNALTGVPQVIRTGKAELYTEIPQALLEASAKDAEHLRMIRDLHLESGMVVPLRGPVRTLGAMTFIYADSGRRYSEADLEFAEDFARRAAMAIENAMAVKALEEAQAREHALRREAEVANRGKDEFLATVSHELRTPLNAILGWTMTLRARKLASELDRPLAIIERNAHAQTKLIEDVLDVSRIVSGKLTLNLGPTNVAEALEAAVETVAPAAEAKSITVVTEIADGALTITADAERLQQVMWNLLTNAVKFTPKGGAVSAKAFREGSEICISVSDTGEGIPPEVLPLVFDPFKQADSTTTRRHGGLGLGLAIVKHIVVAHGGTVRAESDGAGKGARFVVQLPARSAVLAVTPMIHVTGRVLPRLDGLRLLVVDDEDDARMLVGAVLGEQGAEVHLAASAAEAFDMFGRIKLDVVVSDIGMPNMDGYSLIRRIRALSPELGGRTPAVALTAYARSEDAQLAFAAGFQMHVTKPIEPAQLATVVANLGGRSQEPFS